MVIGNKRLLQNLRAQDAGTAILPAPRNTVGIVRLLSDGQMVLRGSQEGNIEILIYIRIPLKRTVCSIQSATQLIDSTHSAATTAASRNNAVLLSHCYTETRSNTKFQQWAI